MRFLADENFPLASTNRLREAGYDVAFIAEYSPGAEDAEVLALAAREERTVLTFDRDYGELIYRSDLPAPDGVVYFRLSSATPEEPAECLLWLLYAPALSGEGKSRSWNGNGCVSARFPGHSKGIGPTAC